MATCGDSYRYSSSIYINSKQSSWTLSSRGVTEDSTAHNIRYHEGCPVLMLAWGEQRCLHTPTHTASAPPPNTHSFPGPTQPPPSPYLGLFWGRALASTANILETKIITGAVSSLPHFMKAKQIGRKKVTRFSHDQKGRLLKHKMLRIQHHLNA